MTRTLLIPLLVSFLFISCTGHSGPSEEMLSEEMYETLFIELAILNQMDDRVFNDITRSELKGRVFDHYGVTQEQFDLSHEYYQSRTETHLQRIERINNKLRDERDLISEAERVYNEKISEKQDTTAVDSVSADSLIEAEVIPQDDIESN